MSLAPDAQIFEAARKAHLGVTVHDVAAFEGMRKAGRLAAEVLDLMCRWWAGRHHCRAGQGGV